MQEPGALEQLDRNYIIMYRDSLSVMDDLDFQFPREVIRDQCNVVGNIPEDVSPHLFPTSTQTLPTIELFQGSGFKVIGAPSTPSTAFFTIPNFAHYLPNFARVAACITEKQGLGVVMTLGSDNAACLETLWHIILWGSDQCWRPRPIDSEVIAAFDAHFNATYFGCPETAPRNLTEILLRIFPIVEANALTDQIRDQEEGFFPGC